MTARAWAGFATMSVLWGIPYLFIKVAVDDGLSPAFVAWSRVVLAAAVLLVLAHRADAPTGGWGPACRACSAASRVVDEEVERLRIRE